MPLPGGGYTVDFQVDGPAMDRGCVEGAVWAAEGVEVRCVGE